MTVRLAAGIILVSLATIAAACEDDNGTHIGIASGSGSLVGASPVVGASLLPPRIGFASVPARCPSIAPFQSAFSLFIDQRGGSDLFLDRIDLLFADRAGRRSPLPLTNGDLTRMFGPTLVLAGTTRRFDFTTSFGCEFVSLPGTLFIDFITLNRSGVRHRGTLTATLQ